MLIFEKYNFYVIFWMVKMFICKFIGILIWLEFIIWFYRNWLFDKISFILINYNWGYWFGFLFEEFCFDVVGFFVFIYWVIVGIFFY